MKTVVVMLAGFALATCAALVGVCATIVSGSTQEMSFQSAPEDVVVTLIRTAPDENFGPEQTAKDAWKDTPVNGETRILGKTPFTLQLDRVDDPQSVVFSKEGYKPVVMKLATKLNGWFWGNILFGGVLGSTTDGMSGAAHEYAPNQFFVTLTPDLHTSIGQVAGHPQRDRALAFIVRRYAGLMANLHQGAGEDWTALMTLLNIGKGEEADARQKIKALALVYPDIAVFATHATDLYLK